MEEEEKKETWEKVIEILKTILTIGLNHLWRLIFKKK